VFLLMIDRSNRATDRFLVWKVRAFAVGATLGLGGIFLEIPWLVWVAIAVLGAGFVIRFLGGRGDPDPDSQD